jgi:uncharacterized protein involved in cysteine biosynthesis
MRRIGEWVGWLLGVVWKVAVFLLIVGFMLATCIGPDG